jgi:hypothetical protein
MRTILVAQHELAYPPRSKMKRSPEGLGFFSAPSDYDCGAIVAQSFVLLGSAVLPLDYPIENATVVGDHAIAASQL